MAIPDPHVAAREPAAPVAMEQRPPECRRNRPRSSSDLGHPPVLVVPHHHSARVTRQPAGPFPGNVAPLFPPGLAGVPGLPPHPRIPGDPNLISPPPGSGIDPVMQPRLRDQSQPARLLLRPGP